MAQAYLSYPTGLYSKASFVRVSLMAMEKKCGLIKMGKYTKVTGSKGKCMEKESLFSEIRKSISESLRMGSLMGKGYENGKMAIFTKETISMGSSKAW